MTTDATTDQTPVDSTQALLTHRVVTWRQAGEGSAVLVGLGTAAVLAAVLAKVVRLAGVRRG
jgi:hypothetical protein